MIAIVGATGLVGRKIFEGLIDCGFTNLALFASNKSNGKILEYQGKKYTVYTLCESNIEIARPKYAIFSAGKDISKAWAKAFNKIGCIVIDNSSCFRKSKKVPLVAYGINTSIVHNHKGIIANPNCSTLGILPILDDLKPYGLKRVIITTMQSVSGAGKKGLDHLKSDIPYFDQPIKDNIIAQIGHLNKSGYCEEENKLINESKKILNLKKLNITCTTTRVPVSFCHSISLNVELSKYLSKTRLLGILARDNRIVLQELSSPLKTVGTSKVYVSRVRKDNSCWCGYNFFAVSDNLLRGAATNAIEILKEIYEE